MPAREHESGLTILQVLSWLNYGGVESYAIRLASALQQRGHRVLIASSGGQLVPDLESLGIEHFPIDFTGSRTLPGVRTLRLLIEREQVDLVNAHNWRAGMVSSLACRLAGVPYVLTVHGTRNPVNRHGVFYWSRRIVVVSEASRRNLVDGFGLPESRVVLSLIGVDCERFRPSEPDAEFEAECGLTPGAPRIVHVSRFSHSKAPVALALIGVMRALDLAAPGVELLLVGQGPEEQAVAASAGEANERLGRQAVIWLGGRSDIPRLLGLASVVVGTASVALEAMASGKPVVAAGKGGYLGSVTADSLARAEQTCFADHEEVGPITADEMAADLAAILTDGATAAELGRFGRRTAEERYSVPRLGEQVETMYREALCARPEVRSILVFHLNQIGDLMFTLPALKALREAFPRARITSVLRPHLIGLLAESGFVDDIIPRPPGGPLKAVALARQLRRLRPDLAIAFSQSATMAICARLSGARQRIGYVDSDLCRLLNHRVQERGIPCPRKVMHLLRGLGLTPQKTNYVGLVRLSEADEAAGARTLAGTDLAGSGPLVALAPGESADRPYKSWSVEGFTRVGERLAAELDARLIVVGGGKDVAVGDAIASGLRDRARNLAAQTTPAQLAAVLTRCDLLIGIDSGPMHVAAALGVPVVGVFGPTDPARTGPMGEGHEIVFHRQPCAPCMAPTCVDRPCMASISADEVAAAALRILARERGKSDIAAAGG